MPELMFVVKSLAFAVIVAIGLQMQVGSTSLEHHVQNWVRNSSVAQYVQNVASGAVLVIRNGVKSGSEFVSQTFGNESIAQRAGRLNFEFKRSPQYEKEQEEQN
jgi:hypothetical protein